MQLNQRLPHQVLLSVLKGVFPPSRPRFASCVTQHQPRPSSSLPASGSFPIPPWTRTTTLFSKIFARHHSLFSTPSRSRNPPRMKSISQPSWIPVPTGTALWRIRSPHHRCLTIQLVSPTTSPRRSPGSNPMNPSTKTPTRTTIPQKMTTALSTTPVRCNPTPPLQPPHHRKRPRNS